MRKYLLPQTGNFYKASLHLHTTVSDGTLTPEETKAEYQRKGYSIVAYTDHDVFVQHNDLTDDNFLAINAVEIAINPDRRSSSYYRKTYHLNFYAKNPDISLCAFCESSYAWGNGVNYITEEHRNVVWEREYSVQAINKMIARGNADGFLSTYNHPVWSLQNYNDYIGLTGLWGAEVFNATSSCYGYEETVTAYQDLVRAGQKIVPICADDAHYAEHCGGSWMMIKAESLDYASVITAMERGDCYSSTGPEIKELYIEDDAVIIKTSPCEKVALISERRHCGAYHADGTPLTETRFEIRPFLDLSNSPELEFTAPFLRFEVTDAFGKKAYTRAYFLDELR